MQMYIVVPDPVDIRFTDHAGEPAWDNEAVKDSNGEVLRNADGSVVTRRAPAMRNFFSFLCELTCDERFAKDLKGIEAVEAIADVRGAVVAARKAGAKVIALDSAHMRRLQAVVKEADLAKFVTTAHNIYGWCRLVRDASEKDPSAALAAKPPGKAKS